MLVVAWDSLNATIPRFEAEERLTAWSVAVLASPSADEKNRDGIINTWKSLIQGKASKVRIVEHEYLEDGTELKRGRLDIPMRSILTKIRGAFGRSDGVEID